MTHIVNRLRSAFERYGPLTALKIQGEQISYQKLNCLAWQVAGYLLEQDKSCGRVGIFVQRELAAYQGVLGALYADRTYVPINPKSSAEKIRSIVAQANISTLILSEAQLIEHRVLFEALGIEHFLVPDLVASRDLVSKNFPLFNVVGCDWLSEYKSIQSVPYTDSIYIMFTSGSTGVPKGVPINDLNLSSFLDSYQAHFDFEPGFIASQTFDFSFDPSVADLFFTWSHGGQVTVLTQDELYCPSDYIQREEIQIWASVPALAEFMRKLGALEDNAFPLLQRSIFCGEALTKSLAQEWKRAAPNSSIENWYGPTETTIYIAHKAISDLELEDASTNHYVPIGDGLTGHELRIVDTNHGLLEKGGKGELVIKGPQLSGGYLDDLKKTNQSFCAMPWDKTVDNRWYKTGDLVWMDDNGDFCYSGRLDNQIKISGRRIELGEIERCLQVYGGLDPVVVVPVFDDEGIIVHLVAFTTVPLARAQLREINALCKEYIEPIFYPKKIRSIAAFPINFSGKVDRKRLAAEAAGQVESALV